MFAYFAPISCHSASVIDFAGGLLWSFSPVALSELTIACVSFHMLLLIN